jgi:hypothetical protein
MDTMEIEDRIFELFEDKMGTEIVDEVVVEFDIDRAEAWRLVFKVFEERGLPRLVRVKQAVERMRNIRFA